MARKTTALFTLLVLLIIFVIIKQSLLIYAVAYVPAATKIIYIEKTSVYPKSPNYQQVGVLISRDLNEGEPVILPLFGRKMLSSDRWEYYVASNEYHMYKLTVQYENRDCQNNVGCNKILNGELVTVPDYANKVFTAHIKYLAL